MALDKFFFDYVREHIFQLHRMPMTQTEVDCMNAIDKDYAAMGYAEPTYLAYIMATAFHEARFEYYIREVGRGRGKDYGKPDPVTGYVYYGRGLSQITWKRNYEILGERVGCDLVNNPDAALDKDISSEILIVGSMEGLFTGLSLPRVAAKYALTKDVHGRFKAMRAVINGHDKDELIATYADTFYTALVSKRTATEKVTAPPVVSQNAAATEDMTDMLKLLLNPALAASLIHVAVDYGPKAASTIGKGIANSDDIRSRALDMVARLKEFDLPGAVVDFNAILDDLGLTQEDIRNVVHTARVSQPVPNATP